MSASFNSRFVGLDLEATDLSPERGRILEVGAVRWENGKEVAHFSTLIDPGTPIPPIITSITGIREQDVLGKPSFDSIRDELAEFIGDDPIVGHNIAFDVNFLRSQGLPLRNPLYDTWKIATLMLPKASSHSLESLAQDLKLNHPEAHRALHDARVGAELLMYLADRVRELDPVTAGMVLGLVKQNTYSLKNFFIEVLSGVKPAKPSKLKPGWQAHTSHTGERLNSTTRALAKASELSGASYRALFKEAISPIVPAFELRTQQVELAKQVAQALDQRKTIIVEAASGLGRRQAALYAVMARASKGATVYAVGGKHELELVEPTAQKLASYFGKRIVILERPESYIYLPALERVLQRSNLGESQVHLALKLLIWVQQTKTGSLREVAITWEERSLLNEVSCESHSCTTKLEPEKCSFCRAVTESRQASVVVMQQATLLWFIARAQNLLKLDALILDDADELENATVKFFGVYVHQGRIMRLLERAQEIVGEAALEPARNQLALVSGLVGVFLDHQALEAEWSGYRTLTISEALEKDPEFARVAATVENLLTKLVSLTTKLNDKSGTANGGAAAAEVVRGLNHLTAELKVFTKTQHDGALITLSLSAEQQLVLRYEPVGAAQYLQQHLFTGAFPVVVIGPRLTIEQRFEFAKRRFGLAADVLEVSARLPSELVERTKVVLLTDHPDSTEPNWARATAHVIATAAQTLGGRVLGLFGGRGQVLEVQHELEKLLAGTGIKLIAQGISGGRGKTTKTLQRHENAVLLTSHFFMQGRTFTHGFRGIVIAKLPFAVPDESYRAARAKEQQGGFMDLDLPRVTLKVREQFDRLVELPRDRGVLIFADPKMHKGYAAMILRSLPSAPEAIIPTAKLSGELKPFATPIKGSKATPTDKK